MASAGFQVHSERYELDVTVRPARDCGADRCRGSRPPRDRHPSETRAASAQLRRLAAEVPLEGVILEAPYLSTAAVAQQLYPYVPVALLMHDQFRSDQAIGKVRAPILLLHGERDGVIPFSQGEALFSLANQPKRFVRFPEGNYENLPAHGSVAEIRRFLADLEKKLTELRKGEEQDPAERRRRGGTMLERIVPERKELEGVRTRSELLVERNPTRISRHGRRQMRKQVEHTHRWAGTRRCATQPVQQLAAERREREIVFSLSRRGLL